MKNQVFAMFCLFLAVACTPSAEQKRKKEEAQLEKMAGDVMVIHDRVMPKTGTIFKLRKKLMELEQATADSIAAKEMRDAAFALEEADDAMMDWMHKYTAPDESLPFEERKAHYKNEEKKILDVEEMTNSSIGKANALIEKYGKN